MNDIIVELFSLKNKANGYSVRLFGLPIFSKTRYDCQKRLFKIFGIKISYKKRLFAKFSRKNRYAVLKFSYENDYPQFKQELINKGSYTINLGDNIQSYCVKNALQSLKLDKIKSVDRDTLNKLKSKKTLNVIMNAVFANIKPNSSYFPIFIGFNAHKLLLKNMLEVLKYCEPIACRDISTTIFLKSNNIKAFTSGCYSLTLPTRTNIVKNKKIFFVGVSELLKKYIPKDILEYAEFITQRDEVYEYPLSEKTMLEKDEKAIELLERYKNEATLVVTSLLHCASPCIGMGIPVIIARDTFDERFSAICHLTKIYLKDEYNSIDWNPKAIDISEMKNNMLELLRQKIENNVYPQKLIEYFEKVYNIGTTWDERLYTQLNDIMENRIRRMLNLVADKNLNSYMDLGCGQQNLKKYLSNNVQYFPVDFYQTKEDTIRKDFNNSEFLHKNVDCIFCSGIFEYIKNLDEFMSNIAKNCKYLLGSYIFYGDREKPNFIVNNYNQEEFFNICKKYNFEIEKFVPENTYDDIGHNSLFLLKKMT